MATSQEGLSAHLDFLMAAISRHDPWRDRNVWHELDGEAREEWSCSLEGSQPLAFIYWSLPR
jgi:hypothetical protein